MAQQVKLRRSSVAGNKPTTSQLELGELAINTNDGKLYFEKSSSLGESIQEIIVTNTQNTGSINLSGSLNIIGNTSLTGSIDVIDRVNLKGTIGSGFATGYLTNDGNIIRLVGGNELTIENAGIRTLFSRYDGYLALKSQTNTNIEFFPGNNVNPYFILYPNGTSSFAGNLIVTGSLIATSFTGSLFGTASYATNTLSASYSVSASYALVSTSASYAATSSYAQNIVISGSINNVDYIDFNTGSATPAWKSGRIFWDNTDGALAVYNAEQDITLQVGQENWVRVYNASGVLITDGTPVKLVGSHGDVPEIQLAQSVRVSGSIEKNNQILGLATHDIEINTIGYVTIEGVVRGLNTNAFSDGDRLFVSSSAGKLTNIPPPAPYEVIPVGVVVKAGPGGSGIIYVSTQQPIDFSDLSSVLVSGLYHYGDLWVYRPSGSTGVWEHTNQLSGSYNVTGSWSATSFTGSLFGTATTASYALQAESASYATYAATAGSSLTTTSSSYAATASYAPLYLPLTGGTINGDVVLNGTASISYLNVQYESSSVIYSSGSNQLGDATNDIQTLIGTTKVSGSLQVTGSSDFNSNITLHGNIIFDDNATTRTIWNNGYGGAIQLLRSDASSTRWSRIGIVNASGVWAGGLQINSDTTAIFDSSVTATSFTGSFSGSVAAPGSTTQILYNNGGAIAGDSGLVYSGSNVGIGVTNPSAPLHVYKSDTYSAIVSRADWNVAETRLGLGAQYGVLGYISTGIVETTNDTTYIALNYKNGISTYAEGLRVYNNGNVGIGTTTPSELLEVVGNIRANVSNGGGFMLTGASASGLVRAGATGLALRTNTTDRLTIDNSGNVGIGTTSPSYNLHTYGSNSRILIQDPSTGYPILQLNNASGNFYMSIDSSAGTGFGSAYGRYLYSDGAYPMMLVTNDVERIRITSAGNVGIGTTNPTQYSSLFPAQLAVNAGSTVDGIFSTTNDSSAAELVLFKKNPTNGFGSLLIQHSGSSGRAIELNYGVNMSTGVGGTTSYFVNTNGSGYYAGNVGIGVTNPADKLYVLSSGFNVSTFDSSYGQMAISFANSGTIFAQLGSGNSVTPTGASNDLGLGTAGLANNLVFATGTSYLERMRITSAGNVGIGTTSPAYKLDVQGSAGNIARITDGTSHFLFYAGSGLNEIATTGPFLFTVSGSERMRITTAGNVGIGTNSPQRKLHVAGDFAVNASGSQYYGVYIPSNGEGANPTILIGDWWNASGNLTWNSSSRVFNINSLYGSSAAPITFSGNGAERMRIDSTGNVGIGTTSPTAKLDIKGDLIVSSSLIINQNTASLGSGAQTISTNATSSYTAAFYNYTVASGSNARAGQVTAVWNGGSIQYTDVSTTDIGSTLAVAFTASLSGPNVQLTTIIPTSGWTVKTLANLL